MKGAAKAKGALRQQRPDPHRWLLRKRNLAVSLHMSNVEAIGGATLEPIAQADRVNRA